MFPSWGCRIFTGAESKVGQLELLRLLGFCIGTHLFTILTAALLWGVDGLILAWPWAWGFLFEDMRTFRLALWPSVFAALVAFVAAFLYLLRHGAVGFLTSIVPIGLALVAFLAVGEVYAYASMKIEAGRIGTACSERRSFTESIRISGNEFGQWHAWAYNAKDGIHLWSYQFMTFVPAPETKSPGKRPCMQGVEETRNSN